MARRHRGRRDWRAIVKGQADSGQSVVAYCRQQGVSASQFYRWRRRYESAEGAATGDRGFVELRPVEGGSTDPGIVVVTPQGWRLEVALGVEAATLERVLASLMRVVACSP